MPLNKFYDTPQCQLVLWNISETEAELQALLMEKGRGDLIPEPRFKSESRNLEWMAARLSLLEIAGPAAVITYDSLGKPHLENSNRHISISHSGTCVCVYVSDFPAGADIEVISDRVGRIRSKFVNPAEESWIAGQDETMALHLIWAAKEAVFKQIGGGGIFFKEHMELLPVSLSNKGIAVLKYKKYEPRDIRLSYEFLEGMILVYTIAEQNNV